MTPNLPAIPNAPTDGVPIAEASSMLSNIANLYTETLSYKNDIAKIEAKKECVIKEMEHRYGLYYSVFNEIFKERRAVIQKHFEIIDKGMKENDRELIATGLLSLGKIVVNNPISSFHDLKKHIESGGTLEL